VIVSSSYLFPNFPADVPADVPAGFSTFPVLESATDCKLILAEIGAFVDPSRAWLVTADLFACTAPACATA
jgi:hypothetical protein